MVARRQKILDLAIIALLTVVLTWVVMSLLRGQLIFNLLINDAVGFQQYLADLGTWARVAYLGTIILEVLVAFIPGWVIYPAGAAVFGFHETFWLVLLGNFLGASISFWIGDRWGERLLRKFIAPKFIAKFNQYMDRRGTASIFLLKLNPLTSFDLWNYLAGASSLRFWKFTAANLLGIAPLIFLSTFFGEETFAAAPQLLGVLVLIGMLYVVWFVVNLPGKFKREIKNAKK